MIYWICFIALEVRRNYIIIEEDNERPNYFNSFLFRAFCCLIGMIIVYKAQFDPAAIGIKPYIPYVVFCTTSFWTLFPPALALFRKKEKWWIYRGKNSGWISKFSWLSKLSTFIYWTGRAIALVVFIYLLFNPSKLYLWI